MTITGNIINEFLLVAFVSKERKTKSDICI